MNELEFKERERIVSQLYELVQNATEQECVEILLILENRNN